MTQEEAYKSALSSVIGCQNDQLYFYWKGRVALYAALKAMDIKKGDEVIVPAFTCVVVPNAIMYLGAHPVYVDISSDSLNTTLELIKEKVTDKTKCILIQNTFGLSSEVDEIVAFAKERNIPTVEDCTHGFGGTYNGSPNGTRSDFAFYSSQWNKPFSTGVGGILLVNNKNYLKDLAEVNESLIKPGFKARVMLWLLIIFNKFFITDRSYWVLVKLYRFLSKTGLVVGSSSGDELSSPKMPEKFFMGGCNVQYKEGVRALKNLMSMIDLRKKNAKLYTEFLKSNGKYYVQEDFENDHSFLKYPFLVKDRERMLKAAEASSIRLGEWFESQIHPVREEFEKWELDPDKYPISKYKSSHILNLPTDVKNVNKIIRFLENNIEELI